MALFKSKAQARNLRNGLIFTAPWILGFGALYLYPILSSLFFSLNDFNILTPPEWVAFGNYKELFLDDSLFWLSLYNTLFYVIFSVPLGVVIGVAIALFLNLKVKGMAIYRTIYFLPSIVPFVASAVLWIWILNPQYGLVNVLLDKIGISGPGWLADPDWSKPSLILMSWWGVGGAIVIYLAGLQDVPQQLYEAAELDGANWWHKTIHVTLPMITPVIFFNLIMGMIGAFQEFIRPFIMTNGGPLDSTMFYALYLYRNAFSLFKMGYASAMAWLLFVLILVSTLLIFRSSARWVYYGGKG